MDIAEVYRAQDSLQQAIRFVQQADSLIRTQKAVKDLATLSEIYAQGGSVYAQAQRFEEAFAMQKQATLINDSLYRQGRKIDLKQTEERLRLEEYLRQQQQQQEQDKRRIATLQYSGIAVLILVFIVVLLFARRLSQYPMLVRWGAFVVALVMFEFLQVLIEPWIQQYIGTTPLEMLAVNMVLAAFFSPVANFAESRLQRFYGTGHGAV
jgi:tetratricopeptide (TPR) repeat protein